MIRGGTDVFRDLWWDTHVSKLSEVGPMFSEMIRGGTDNFCNLWWDTHFREMSEVGPMSSEMIRGGTDDFLITMVQSGIPPQTC